MKTPLALLAVPVLVLAACSTTEKPRVVTMHSVPGTTLPSAGIESVRYAENIKEYPLGRYIDPNDSRVMHEGHPIYRVESTAKWNLHPNAPVRVPRGPAVRLIDPARQRAATNDEIYMEQQRQKAITTTMTDQSQRLDVYVAQLNSAMDKTKGIAAQNVELKKELAQTKVRLREADARTAPPVSANQPQPQKKPDLGQWEKW